MGGWEVPALFHLSDMSVKLLKGGTCVWYLHLIGDEGTWKTWDFLQRRVSKLPHLLLPIKCLLGGEISKSGKITGLATASHFKLLVVLTQNRAPILTSVMSEIRVMND